VLWRVGTLAIGQCPRFQALGQRHPAQAYFIRCSAECEQFGQLHLPEFVDLATAQVAEGYRQPGDETKCIAYRNDFVKTKQTSIAVFLASASFSYLKTYVLKPAQGFHGSQAVQAMLLRPVLGRGLHLSTFQLNLTRAGHTSPCPPV